MTTRIGGCLCGAVRYSTDAEPIRTGVCHCTICQRNTGSAFGTLMAFPAGSIAVTGTLTTYTEPGGTSGLPMHRRFCPKCGSPILLEREGGERSIIHVGTLDDRSQVKPTINIFCDSAQKWVPITPDTQNFPGPGNWT
jgi:hypothetical protein